MINIHMLVLHMSDMYGSLALWGEKSGKGNRREGRHPWAATAKDLKSVPGLEKGGMTKAEVWLPSTVDGPVPSSSMIHEYDDTATHIAPWRVQARILTTEEAIRVIQWATSQRMLGGDIVVGDDMAWWGAVLRLAASMVARQQFLPDVVTSGNGYRAAWHPVFVGEDDDRLKSVAARMPAAARCLSRESSDLVPTRPAVKVLWGVLSNMIDHMVRTAMSGGERRGRRLTRFESIHDAWLYSLRTTHDAISGSETDLRQLTEHVREWQHPVGVMAGSPFRLCFRVEEPDEEQDMWKIRYLVQPNDDHSMLIPAETVWRDATRRNLRGQLLFMLGQASHICPGVSAGLSGGSPMGHTVDATGAHRFLTQEAGALRQAGYGIMLPAWWTSRGERRRLAAKARVQQSGTSGTGILNMDSILRFNWEVAIGDQTITVKELKKMAAGKSPLVKVRGKWMEVGADEIRAAIKLLKTGHTNGTLRDAVMMEVGAGGTPEGLEWGGVSATNNVSDVLDQLGGRVTMEKIPHPDGFVGELRPYQSRGYMWLSFLRQWGLGGCLADDMGLGKTIQVLALLQRDREVGERRPALLVCPTSVINNWKREAARFTPELSVMIHHGADRAKGAAFAKAAASHSMVVTSYGLLQRDIQTVKNAKWSGVVLDEAQNIKNPQTKQSKAVRTVPADYQFALTGTPVENSVSDLWSIMEFLNPGLLGSQEQFRRKFLIPIRAGQNSEAVEKLRRATGPFILRRLKTDKSVISDLPAKMEIKEYCNLTKEQGALYASILQEVEEAMYEAEGMQRRGLILATMSKLKQVCNHPAHFLKDNSTISDRSGKLERLIQMLEEVIESGDKALVFTQFVDMGHILKRHIEEAFGREVLFLHGGTTRRRRDVMVDRFTNEDVQVFIVSLKAGGTGLNLTAATHVFHYDRWWNPAVEDQATDRAFRIGQTKNVQVRKMICAGTLEEKIDQVIERKKEVAGSVVGTGEGWLTELSNDELRDVLALSWEAAT